MKHRVTGISRSTGEESTITVDAANAADARSVAERSMVVQAVAAEFSPRPPTMPASSDEPRQIEVRIVGVTSSAGIRLGLWTALGFLLLSVALAAVGFGFMVLVLFVRGHA